MQINSGSKVAQYCKANLYHRIPPLYRVISIILILTFLAETVAWAYPDSFKNNATQNNKLAAPSFFKDEESVNKAYVKFVEGLIEENGIPRDKLSLDAVKAVLRKHQKEKWFNENLSYAEFKNEILINLPSGFILRYYYHNPEFTRELPSKYGNQVITTRSVNDRLHKQLLRQEALPVILKGKPNPLGQQDKAAQTKKADRSIDDADAEAGLYVTRDIKDGDWRKNAVRRLNELYREYYSKPEYEGVAPTGYTDIGFFQDAPIETIRELFEKINPKLDRFLDLGSGDGRVVLLAAIFGMRAVGIEYDPKLIKISDDIKEKLVAEGIIRPGQVEFKEGNFMEEKFNFTEYDIIFHTGGSMASRDDVDLIVKRKKELEEKLAGQMRDDAILLLFRERPSLPPFTKFPYKVLPDISENKIPVLLKTYIYSKLPFAVSSSSFAAFISGAFIYNLAFGSQNSQLKEFLAWQPAPFIMMGALIIVSVSAYFLYQNRKAQTIATLAGKNVISEGYSTPINIDCDTSELMKELKSVFGDDLVRLKKEIRKEIRKINWSAVRKNRWRGIVKISGLKIACKIERTAMIDTYNVTIKGIKRPWWKVTKGPINIILVPIAVPLVLLFNHFPHWLGRYPSRLITTIGILASVLIAGPGVDFVRYELVPAYIEDQIAMQKKALENLGKEAEELFDKGLSFDEVVKRLMLTPGEISLLKSLPPGQREYALKHPVESLKRYAGYYERYKNLPEGTYTFNLPKGRYVSKIGSYERLTGTAVVEKSGISFGFTRNGEEAKDITHVGKVVFNPDGTAVSMGDNLGRRQEGIISGGKVIWSDITAWWNSMLGIKEQSLTPIVDEEYVKPIHSRDIIDFARSSFICGVWGIAAIIFVMSIISSLSHMVGNVIIIGGSALFATYLVHYLIYRNIKKAESLSASVKPSALKKIINTRILSAFHRFLQNKHKHIIITDSPQFPFRGVTDEEKRLKLERDAKGKISFVYEDKMTRYIYVYQNEKALLSLNPIVLLFYLLPHEALHTDGFEDPFIYQTTFFGMMGLILFSPILILFLIGHAGYVTFPFFKSGLSFTPKQPSSELASMRFTRWVLRDFITDPKEKEATLESIKFRNEKDRERDRRILYLYFVEKLGDEEIAKDEKVKLSDGQVKNLLNIYRDQLRDNKLILEYKKRVEEQLSALENKKNLYSLQPYEILIFRLFFGLIDGEKRTYNEIISDKRIASRGINNKDRVEHILSHKIMPRLKKKNMISKTITKETVELTSGSAVSKYAGMKFAKWVLINFIPHSKRKDMSQAIHGAKEKEAFIKYFLDGKTYEVIAKEAHSYPSEVHHILNKYATKLSNERLILEWRETINEALEELGREKRLLPYEILVFKLYYGLRDDGREYASGDIVKEVKRISSKNKRIDASQVSRQASVYKIINEQVAPKIFNKLGMDLVEAPMASRDLEPKAYQTKPQSPQKFDKNLKELYGIEAQNEKELDKKLLSMLKGYERNIRDFEALVKSAIRNVESAKPNKAYIIILKLSEIAPKEIRWLFDQISAKVKDEFFEKIEGGSIVKQLLLNSKRRITDAANLRIGPLISILFGLIPLTLAFSYAGNNSAWLGVIIGSVLLAVDIILIIIYLKNYRRGSLPEEDDEKEKAFLIERKGKKPLKLVRKRNAQGYFINKDNEKIGDVIFDISEKYVTLGDITITDESKDIGFEVISWLVEKARGLGMEFECTEIASPKIVHLLVDKGLLENIYIREEPSKEYLPIDKVDLFNRTYRLFGSDKIFKIQDGMISEDIDFMIRDAAKHKHRSVSVEIISEKGRKMIVAKYKDTGEVIPNIVRYDPEIDSIRGTPILKESKKVAKVAASAAGKDESKEKIIIDSPPSSWSEVFGNENPIEAEIGFGDGGYLINLAKNNPNINYVGFGLLEEGMSLDRIANENIKNIRLVYENAVYELENYFSENSLSAVHIKFPYLLGETLVRTKEPDAVSDFAKVIFRNLKPRGRLLIDTEISPVAMKLVKQFEKIGGFVNLYGEKKIGELQQSDIDKGYFFTTYARLIFSNPNSHIWFIRFEKQPKEDGYIMQGEEAFKRMVGNIAKDLEKKSLKDVTNDSTIKADLKAIDERLKTTNRKLMDVPSRIIVTDELIISENDFAFGFNSHAPPVREKLIETLGKEKFDTLFPEPTLVLTRKILRNTNSLIRQEYIYHEMKCPEGHYEAIFDQQEIFKDNYKEGKKMEDGRMYLAGYEGDSSNPFKGKLGKALRKIIDNAIRQKPSIIPIILRSRLFYPARLLNHLFVKTALKKGLIQFNSLKDKLPADLYTSLVRYVILSLYPPELGYVAQHAREVADGIRFFAKEYGMEDDDIEILKFAALLHDLGKGVSREMIKAVNAKMSYKDLPEEYQELLGEHSQKSLEMLRPLEAAGLEIPGIVKKIILYHHPEKKEKSATRISNWIEKIKNDPDLKDTPIQEKVIDMIKAFYVTDAYFASKDMSRPYLKEAAKRSFIAMLIYRLRVKFQPELLEYYERAAVAIRRLEHSPRLKISNQYTAIKEALELLKDFHGYDFTSLEKKLKALMKRYEDLRDSVKSTPFEIVTNSLLIDKWLDEYESQQRAIKILKESFVKDWEAIKQSKAYDDRAEEWASVTIEGFDKMLSYFETVPGFVTGRQEKEALSLKAIISKFLPDEFIEKIPDVNLAGNSASIGNLFENIYENAKRAIFVEKGQVSPGDIEVNFYPIKEDGFVEVEIKDKGPGIGAKDLEKIWRLAYSTTDGGVGLCEVLYTAKDHNIEIGVISKQRGEPAYKVVVEGGRISKPEVYRDWQGGESGTSFIFRVPVEAIEKRDGSISDDSGKNIPESLTSVINMLELRFPKHGLIRAINELFKWEADFINKVINEVDSLADEKILEQAAKDLGRFSEREKYKNIPNRTDNLTKFIGIETIGDYDIFELLQALYIGSLYYNYQTLEIEKKPDLITKNEDELKEEFKGLYTFLKAISITLRKIRDSSISADSGKDKKRDRPPATSQIGKLAKVSEVFVRNNKRYLRVVDSEDKSKVLGELELITENKQALENALNKLIKEIDSSQYKAILNAFLKMLKTSPPEFYIFTARILDLFGHAHASTEDKLIALHKSLLANPIAIFHEVGEYLISSKILNLTLEDDILRVFLKEEGKEKITFDVTLSKETFNFIKKENWHGSWQNSQHYLLRILQREMFKEMDMELTQKIQDEQKEVLKRLDASPNLLWTLIRDDPEAGQEFKDRCEFLLKNGIIASLKDELIQLAKDGKIIVKPEDIEKIDVVIFGDWFRRPKNTHSEDLDLLLIFRGKGNYRGIFNSNPNLPPLVTNIRNVEDFKKEAGLARNLTAILRGNGIIIHGGSLVSEIGLKPFLATDILGWAKGLLDEGDKEKDLGDLGDPRRQWERYLEALLYIHHLLPGPSKDELGRFLKDYIDAQPDSPQKQTLKDSLGEDVSFKEFFVRYFLGKIEILPWSMSNSEDLIDGFREVVDSLIEDIAKHLITLKTDRDVTIEVWHDRFPDGELYLRILDPDPVKDANVIVASSGIDSPDDLVRLVLLMDMLRRYGAKNIKLILDKHYASTNSMDEVLRYYCDAIAYYDNRDIREIEVAPLKPVKKKSSVWIDRVLYRHPRLEDDVQKAATSVNAKYGKVEILGKETGNPLIWQASLPKNLKDENVVLVHNMQGNENIVELWIILAALRRAGVASISLVNTYEGYARQDKVFRAGEGIGAVTMLKITDALLDNHLAFNIHYGKRSGWVQLEGYRLYNSNAFVQIAETLVDAIAEWVGKDNLAKEFQRHPILLVSPDDGAFGYVQEAADLLPKYIKEKYNIDTKVHRGYMDKQRISATEVRIGPNVFGADGKPLRNVGDIKTCWAFVLDDETSQGSSLLAATYVLVRRFGIPWQRVLSGIVHGKLVRGLKPFETGWSKDQLRTAVEPKPIYINETKGLMPPRFIVSTESVALPSDFPEEQRVDIGPNVSHAVKRIIGKARDRKAGKTGDGPESFTPKQDLPPNLGSIESDETLTLDSYDIKSHEEMRNATKYMQQIQIWGERLAGVQEYDNSFNELLSDILEEKSEKVRIILIRDNRSPPGSMESLFLLWEKDPATGKVKWIFSHAGTRGLDAQPTIYLKEEAFRKLIETKEDRDFLKGLLNQESAHALEKLEPQVSRAIYDEHRRADNEFRRFVEDEIIAPSQDITSFKKLIDPLGIKDDVYGDKIFGMDMIRWCRERRLIHASYFKDRFRSEDEKKLYIEKAARDDSKSLGENNFFRLEALKERWALTEAEKDIVTEILQEMKSGRSFSPNESREISTTILNIVIRVMSEHIEADLGKDGKLFEAFDISNIKDLFNLPIIPLYPSGVVNAELFDKVREGDLAALDRYRMPNIKKASLAELCREFGLKPPPKQLDLPFEKPAIHGSLDRGERLKILAKNFVEIMVKSDPHLERKPNTLVMDILEQTKYGDIKPEDMLAKILELIGQTQYIDIYLEALRLAKEGKPWNLIDTRGLEELLGRLKSLGRKQEIDIEKIKLSPLGRDVLSNYGSEEVDDFKNAAGMLNSLVKNDTKLDEETLKELHAKLAEHLMVRVAGGRVGPVMKGKYRGNDATRDLLTYPYSSRIPYAMKSFFEFIYSNEFLNIHPVEQASIVLYLLMNIQPFENGNTRTASLFMDYILMRNNYPPFVLTEENEKKFYEILRFMKTLESGPLAGGAYFNQYPELIFNEEDRLPKIRNYAGEFSMFLAQETEKRLGPMDVGQTTVLLINPNRGTTFKSIKPIGLARISASLKANSISNVKFIDANRKNLSAAELAEEVARLRKENKGIFVLGISILPGDKDYLEKFLKALPKELKDDRDFIISAGGYLPTMEKENFLEEFSDICFIIKGEGESAFSKAVTGIVSGRGLEGVENVMYRAQNNQIITNPHRLLTKEELDKLPYPDWSILIDPHDIFMKKALIDTSRGCLGFCTFCGIHGFFDELDSSNRLIDKRHLDELMWRPMSAKQVVDVLEHLYKIYGITGFDFVDDDFIGNNPQRAEEIASEIMKRNLKINFWLLTRVKSVVGKGDEEFERNREIFKKLKAAGLKLVFLGIESMDEDQLKFYGKGVSIEENIKIIEMFQELGIDLKIGFINFYRNSTLEQIRKNIKAVKRYELEPWIPTPTSILRVYKNTHLYDRYIKEGVELKPIGRDAYAYDFLDEKVSYLYEWTKVLADKSYPFMMHFRELQELKYYYPSKLSKEAETVYMHLKKMEFEAFEKSLDIIERDQLDSAKSKIELLSQYYYSQMIDTIRRFNQWAEENGYDAAYRLSEEEAGVHPLKEMRRILEKDEDAWIAFGDFLKLWNRNLVYGEKIMDFFISETILIADKVAKKYGGSAELLVADEVIIAIPKKYAKAEVEKILSEIHSEITKRFRNRFAFAALDTYNDELMTRLKNNPQIKGIADLSTLDNNRPIKKKFILFEKEPQDSGEEALKELSAALGGELKARIDFEVLTPWMPMGAIQASQVGRDKAKDMDDWIANIIKESCSLQNLAKGEPSLIKMGPVPHKIKEEKKEERQGYLAGKEWNDIVEDGQTVQGLLKSRRYSLETNYPSYMKHTLKTILHDAVIYAGKEAALYKINPAYETSDEELFEKMLEGRGTREFRKADKGRERFGFKSIQFAYGHKFGDELILLINYALDDFFRRQDNGFTVNIVRGPPDTFYIALIKDRDRAFLSSEEILSKLDEAKKIVDKVLESSKINIKVFFDISSATTSDIKDSVEELIAAVDSLSQARESVEKEESPLGSGIKDYKEIRNKKALEEERIKSEAHLREHSKETLLTLKNLEIPNKPLVLVLGYPGSGKGSIGKMLGDKLKMPYFSIGELVREELEKDPNIISSADSGFVLLNTKIQERKTEIDNGIIIDSNPPFAEWKGYLAHFMRDNRFSLAAVVHVKIEEDTARKRMAERSRPRDLEPLKEGGPKTKIDVRVEKHQEIVLPLIEELRQKGVPIIEVENEDVPQEEDLNQYLEDKTEYIVKSLETLSEYFETRHYYDQTIGQKIYIFKEVHDPRDDSSKLMLKTLGAYFEKRPPQDLDILDMGCGTSIDAIFAVKQGAKSVTAGDISDAAIECSKRNIREAGLEERITLAKGDLFENLANRKFGLIVFNLPGYPDRDEVTERFFKELAEHLTPDGEAIVTWPIDFSLTAADPPLYNGEELRKRASEHGLAVTFIQELGNYRTYSVRPEASQAEKGVESPSEKENVHLHIILAEKIEGIIGGQVGNIEKYVDALSRENEKEMVNKIRREANAINKSGIFKTGGITRLDGSVYLEGAIMHMMNGPLAVIKEATSKHTKIGLAKRKEIITRNIYKIEAVLKALKGAAKLPEVGSDKALIDYLNPLVLIEALHSLMLRGASTTPAEQRFKILLSKGLFSEDDIVALKCVLDENVIEIASPEDIRNASANGSRASKDKLAIVVTRDEFNSLWNDSHRNNNKATVLVLDDDLKDSRYLYVEGVIGLAKAMMNGDANRINSYSNLLFGNPIDDAALEYLKKDNPIEFAIKTILKFKPIERIDPEELGNYKRMVEKYLQSA